MQGMGLTPGWLELSGSWATFLGMPVGLRITCLSEPKEEFNEV